MSGAVPANPRIQFPSSTGGLLPGGFVDVFTAGTTTRATTWQDKALTTPNQNPIALDTAGSCSLWTDPSQSYDFVVKDANSVVQYTLHNIVPSGVSPTVATFNVDTFSGNGSQTAFTLSATPAGINNTDVYVGGVYQKKSAYSLTGSTLNFVAAPASGTNNVEVNTLNVTEYSAVAANIAAQVATATAQATAAAASRTAIDDRIYPGTYSVAPTLRPDGSAIQNGDRYVNSVDGYEYIRVSGAWTNAPNSATAAAASAALAGTYAGAAGAIVSSLIGTEATAIAISAEDVATSAMKVLDAANPANNKSGRVTDMLSGVFPAPKLTIQSDGRTLKWSPHNLYRNSNAPTASGATLTTGQTDSDGTATAFKITGTSNAYAGIQAPAAAFLVRYYMQEFIVRVGTNSFAHITFDDGSNHSAYFNLGTGAVGTQDAGVTGAIFTTREDGTALPAGYYRITAYYVNTAGGAINLGMGACDADASRFCTVGRTLFMEKPLAHYGVQSLKYVENIGTSVAVQAPYDYSKGGPRILIEPTTVYNSRYGNDLTNAAWTATNITAAYTATGPDGAPCSTLTASAINGAILQAIVDATAAQLFTAFVKRRTGTGSIFMTTDGGATYTDITSQINSTYYVRLQLAAVANPSIGFKIGTSGDAIDVAYAINTNSNFISSPLPVTSANVTRTADSFIVPTTLMTAGTSYSWYADFDRLTGTKTPDDSMVRVGKSDFSQEMRVSCVIATGNVKMTVNDGSVIKDYPLWNLSSGERMEVTGKIETSKHVMSVNGDVPGYLSTAAAVTVQQAKLAVSAPMFLRKLLIVPRAVDKDSVQTWRYSGAVRNKVLSSAVVAWDSDPAFPNTQMNREPAMCVLSDDGNVADVAVFWVQRHDVDNAGNVEAPCRLMQRNYRFTKSTGTLIPLTSASVVLQQAGWVNGFGHVQSPNAFVIPSGANAGRVVLLVTELENNTFSPDQRSLYVMTNDPNGSVRGDPTRWSAPTRILAATSGQYFVLDPDGSTVVLSPTHPVAPNRLVTTYYGLNFVKSIYSDNFGTTWNFGTAFFPATQPDESTLSVWPDGTLIMTSRVEAGSLFLRNWAKSTDGGVNWVDQGTLSGFSYGQCADGAVQLDPTGATGAYGKTATSHPSDATTRLGVQIDFATDAAMTFGSPIKPWAPNATLAVRYFGYSAIRALFGGTHLALSVEGGSVPFDTDNSIFVGFVQVTS